MRFFYEFQRSVAFFAFSAPRRRVACAQPVAPFHKLQGASCVSGVANAHLDCSDLLGYAIIPFAAAILVRGALSDFLRVARNAKALVNGKKRGEQWGGEFFILEQRLTIRICGI